MVSVLRSPRKRRRLAWLLGAATVVVALTLIGLAVDEDPVPDSAVETSTTAAIPVARPIRLTAAMRREVDATIERFVRTAVVRRNPGSAWALAGPGLRAGSTERDWRRGDLPAQPYPGRSLERTDWHVVYAQPDRVAIDVSLVPKQRSGAAYAVYNAEVIPVGRGAARHWLIDSWAPAATLGAAAPADQPDADPPVAAPAPSPHEQGKLSAAWFLLPASLVLGLVLLLAGAAARAALRRRRAERLYRQLADR
ncbi:MAG: hypothetical protein H0V40_04055 [Actinobacteria bacterium]|nr:hypothetical protein [Actinomycetota bacterium]